VVVEAGAGTGTLAASILADGGLPGSTRYVAVERSAVLRRVAADRLAGRADVVGSLPAGPFDGVVLANELLDNLPFRLLQRTGDTSGRQDDQFRHQFAPTLATGDTSGPQEGPFRHQLGWAELFVDADLAEVLVPVAPDVAAEADRLAPGAPAGARIPLHAAAHDWVADAIGRLRRGRVVVVDYADVTSSMATRPWTEWVRTYRGHGRAGHPLDDLGSADITCEVAVDQLPTPDHNRPQADFLRAHGIDDLVATARREWTERAHVGDLQALRSRSRVTEAGALTDPTGLGAFRVLEWEVPG